MAIQIKEGRYYKDYKGNVGGPAKRGDHAGYPWVLAFSFGLSSYTNCGGSCLGGTGSFDLVSECDVDGNPIEDEAMSDAAQLVMKEGAYYEDYAGNVRGPLGPTGDKDFPWYVNDMLGEKTFTAKGTIYMGDTAARCGDLVREVPAPASAAPKPEPVTITQEMVDRAILDAVKAGDASRAVEIHDAWDDLRRVMQQKADQQDKPQTDDGWIPWKGGGHPVGPHVCVQVRTGNGSTLTGKARQFEWLHDGSGSNVYAYRIVK